MVCFRIAFSTFRESTPSARSIIAWEMTAMGQLPSFYLESPGRLESAYSVEKLTAEAAIVVAICSMRTS